MVLDTQEQPRFFQLGDCHSNTCGEINKLSVKKFPESKELSKQDIVIQCGDLGLYWSYPGYHYEEDGLKKFRAAGTYYKEEEHFKDWIAKQKYTFVWIDGNHENFDIIKDLPEKKMFGNMVKFDRRKCGTIYYLKRGFLYNISGKNILSIGGAMSQDKASRKSGIDWWAQEEPSYQDIENTFDTIEYCKENNIKIDMIVSHTFPDFVVDEFLGFRSGQFGSRNPKAKDPTSAFLTEVYNCVQPEIWIGGHLHVNKELIHTLGDTQTTFRCHYNKSPLEIEFKK